MSHTGVLKQINRSNGGLPKRSVSGRVMLEVDGVEGDGHRDLKHHGGRDKAVLMIAAELIDSLAARGFPIYYGALGENLTVSGLDPHMWRAGQRYRIGDDALIATDWRRHARNTGFQPVRRAGFQPALADVWHRSTRRAGSPPAAQAGSLYSLSRHRFISCPRV